MSQIPNFLRSMVEKNPLANDGTNFSSWILKLKIILRLENLSFVLEQDDPVFVDDANPTQKELTDKKLLGRAVCGCAISDVEHHGRSITEEVL